MSPGAGTEPKKRSFIKSKRPLKTVLTHFWIFCFQDKELEESSPVNPKDRPGLTPGLKQNDLCPLFSKTKKKVF